MPKIDPSVISALAAPFAETPPTATQYSDERQVQEYSTAEMESMPGTSTDVTLTPIASQAPAGLTQGPRDSRRGATQSDSLRKVPVPPASTAPSGAQPKSDASLNPQQMQDLLDMVNLGKRAETDLKNALTRLSTPSASLKNLAREKYQIEAAHSEQLGAAYDEKYKAEYAQVAREQHLADAHRVERKRFEDQIDDVHREMMAHEVDPRRMFKNSWQALGAALASAMGAFAQAYHPGKIPNTALLVIDRAIKRDIDAQKIEFRKMGMMAGIKQTAYSRLLQTHGDERRAELQTGVLAIKLINKKIEKEKLRFETTRQKLAADIVAAQLDQKSKELANLEQARQSGAILRTLISKGLYGPGAIGGAGAAEVDNLSNKDKEVLSLWGTASGGFEMLALADKGLGIGSYGPMASLSRNMPYVWNSVKAYDQAVDMVMTDIIYAMSGKTVTKIELEKTWKPKFPKAEHSDEKRKEKTIAILQSMATKGSSWLRTLNPGQQAHFAEANPDFMKILGKTHPIERLQEVRRFYEGHLSSVTEAGEVGSGESTPEELEALRLLEELRNQGGQQQ